MTYLIDSLRWIVSEVGIVLWNWFQSVISYLGWPAKELFHQFMNMMIHSIDIDWTVIIQYGWMLDAFLPLQLMYNSFCTYITTVFMCFAFRLVIKLVTVGQG